MKYHLVYFSSTGNTQFLTEKSAELIKEAGHEVVMFEALTGNIEEIISGDIIGLHFPIWGSEAAKPMQLFLHQLVKTPKKLSVYMISNCAKMPGNGTAFEAKWLAKESHGKIDTFYTHNLFMPCNFNIGIFNLHQTPKKIQSLIDAALSELKKSIEAILAHQHSIDKGPSLLKPIFPIIRHVEPLFLRHLGKKLHADSDLCIRCRMCVKICPVENIELNSDNNIEYHDHCVFCLKCYNFCPKLAINVGKKTADTEKYTRYRGPEKRPRVTLYRK